MYRPGVWPSWTGGAGTDQWLPCDVGTAVDDTNATLPRVIQGGMGVAISAWPLARAVASTGQLGVVSGTALEVVCARRLQLGDPGGHVRRALEAFPLPGIAERIVSMYYVPGGKSADAPFRPVPRFTLKPAPVLQELTIAANFVELLAVP